MWKRSFCVLFAVFALFASWPETVQAADQITLSPGHIVGEWRNVNDLILALAGSIAMDEEWPQKLRNMKPKPSLASTPQAIAQAIDTFKTKLNVLLKSEDLKTLKAFRATSNFSVPVLYMRSGQILDGLAEYLITSDSLATVGIYYKGQDFTGKSSVAVAGEISIATQRLDSFIKESGL